MCYCDFKYSNNNIFLVGFDSLTKNKFQKGFLDLKIFSLDGTPIDNANIRVFEVDGLNEYIINIDALGYYPVQFNNVRLYPTLFI